MKSAVSRLRVASIRLSHIDGFAQDSPRDDPFGSNIASGVASNRELVETDILATRAANRTVADLHAAGISDAVEGVC